VLNVDLEARREKPAGLFGFHVYTQARMLAGVAQLVEHFTRNEGVSGSSPLAGFA
jgi:hypothetical protein